MHDSWATHPGSLLQGPVSGFKAPWVPLSELVIALPVVVFSLLQRKSSKAKEKKQKRLEERAAMDAVCAKVDAANRLGDPLEAFPVFKKYDRNGLNVSIECKRVSGLEPATVDWAFDLTKTNMQTM